LLILSYFGAFLASSFLGASSGKRMQKPLGAHHKDSMIVVKENTAVCVLKTKVRLLYWKFDIMRLFTSILHCFSSANQTHHSYHHQLSLICSIRQEEAPK
jgi:hypothetical protein